MKEIIKEIIARLAGPGIVGLVDRTLHKDEDNETNEGDDASMKEAGEVLVDRLNTQTRTIE